VNVSAGPVRVTLQLAVDRTDEFPDEQAFSTWANAALAASGTDLPDSGCVTIRVVTSAESTELNGSYRDIHRPTNVLAFPAGTHALPEGSNEEVELGDLVICYDVIVGEAEEQHKTLRAHLAHLTVHGSLHLAGFDHLEAAEANVMESLETQVLETLGFENPYLNDDRDTPGA
jgi:probable rRNA maturation factor